MHRAAVSNIRKLIFFKEDIVVFFLTQRGAAREAYFLTFITVAHASRIMCKPIMYVHIICMKAFTLFMGVVVRTKLYKKGEY